MFTPNTYEVSVAAVSTVLLTAGMLQGAATFSTGVSQGTVTASAINEASGLIASRDNAQVFWTHNDDGGPDIFALDATGKLLGRYTLTGATNNDWEDIAVGPGPVAGVNYLYLMGSASGNQTTIYRVPEPAVYGRQAASPLTRSISGAVGKTFTLTGSPVTINDSEAMFVDPVQGDIYVGSKESGTTRFFRATQSQFASPSAQSAAYMNVAVPLSNSNGADISVTGREIIIRNQNESAYFYTRNTGETIAQAFNRGPIGVEINGKSIEPNAESITFDADGVNLYTFSEGVGQKLYKYTRTSNDAPAVQTTLLNAGSSWKYLSGGAVPAGDFKSKTFNDSSWSTGEAQFGYGNSDEKTVIPYGPSASNKAPSAFFRTTFEVTEGFDSLTLKLLYDDGAAVYLNGVEITRQNLAAGAAPNAFALAALSNDLQNSWLSLAIDPALLIAGTNTLAVEIHGASATDTDLRFDLQLKGFANGQPIPEPTVLSLAAIGGAALLRRRRAR